MSKVRGYKSPRVANQGGAASVYEQPLRRSGTPRATSTAGSQKFVNVSETKPGSGTRGDATTARKPKC